MWPSLDRVIDCLEVVETGGIPETKRDTVVGDGGRALGRLQIHVICVEDVNRILGSRVYRPNDRTDRQKSRDMCGVYLRHWGARMPSVHCTRAVCARNLARIWNGGPKGWAKDATLSYARKFDALWETMT
jgi:hypothetical protein